MRTPWVVLLLAANVVTKSDDEWKTNYEHVGAWVGSSLESSPIFFQGKLYLMQSQMGPFPLLPEGRERQTLANRHPD